MLCSCVCVCVCMYARTHARVGQSLYLSQSITNCVSRHFSLSADNFYKPFFLYYDKYLIGLFLFIYLLNYRFLSVSLQRGKILICIFSLATNI